MTGSGSVIQVDFGQPRANGRLCCSITQSNVKPHSLSGQVATTYSFRDYARVDCIDAKFAVDLGSSGEQYDDVMSIELVFSD